MAFYSLLLLFAKKDCGAYNIFKSVGLVGTPQAASIFLWLPWLQGYLGCTI